MFEISIALKYLRPKWRQLSVSIISLISILVIALVVWLIVVFFSVTQGLEKNWIQKLISLTAPLRITPTEEYYKSHYYLIDTISAESNYTSKSIGEKLHALNENPYDPAIDEEIPPAWPQPILANGKPIDLVKKVFHSIHNLPGYRLKAKDYEVTGCNLKMRLLRDKTNGSVLSRNTTQSSLSQACYLGSIDQENTSMTKSLLKLTMDDLNNLLKMIAVQGENADDSFQFLSPQEVKANLKKFFQFVNIDQLSTGDNNWMIPKSTYPNQGKVKALKISKEGRAYGVFLPMTEAQLATSEKKWKDKHFDVQKIELTFKEKKVFVEDELLSSFLYLEPHTSLASQLVEDSLDKVFDAPNLVFKVKFTVQNKEFEGTIPLGPLTLGHAEFKQETLGEIPYWMSRAESEISLLSDANLGEGVLLPKSFKDAGLLVGDRGFVNYYSPTISSVQEQRLPVYIAGFYDQGIISIGGKFILANPHFVNIIRTSQMQEGNSGTNGINIRLENQSLDQVGAIKMALQEAFEKEGIAPYWKINTFEEYDFTKDILQQLRSDKNLFLLIAMVIIIVACSNIISMLVILVNDKKLEIGILRSMGASSLSIGAIFGFCGIAIGVLGSLLGTLAAAATLKNLDQLVYLLSLFQGHQAFNPIYYGEALPNQMSVEAALFVVISTAVISLISGLVPAIKAGMLRPSTVLRSE